MTQRLRVLFALVENPALAPGTHMVAHSSSFRELTRSFGLLGQQARTWHTDIYAGNTHTHTPQHNSGISKILQEMILREIGYSQRYSNIWVFWGVGGGTDKTTRHRPFSVTDLSGGESGFC